MRVAHLIRNLLTRLFPPRSLGYRGERAAERFLRRQGYIILARGHRDRLGELDLIAVDVRTVVFVEVKTRTRQDTGHPADAVDADKQKRMTRAALAYLKRHDLLECSARFDVVAVTWPDHGSKPKIEHFVSAFSAVGMGQMFA